MKKPVRYGDFHEYVRRAIYDPEDAAELLRAVAEYGDNAVFLLALKDVLAVHGSLSVLSRKTGLSRANLHEMLRGNTSPRLDTLSGAEQRRVGDAVRRADTQASQAATDRTRTRRNSGTGSGTQHTGENLTHADVS